MPGGDTASLELVKLTHKVETLEKALERINKVCCSDKAWEQHLKSNMLLERLVEDIEHLRASDKERFDEQQKVFAKQQEEFKDLKKVVDSYTKWLYIFSGVVMAFQFLGVGDKVKTILLG